MHTKANKSVNLPIPHPHPTVQGASSYAFLSVRLTGVSAHNTKHKNTYDKIHAQPCSFPFPASCCRGHTSHAALLLRQSACTPTNTSRRATPSLCDSRILSNRPHLTRSSLKRPHLACSSLLTARAPAYPHTRRHKDCLRNSSFPFQYVNSEAKNQKPNQNNCMPAMQLTRSVTVSPSLPCLIRYRLLGAMQRTTSLRIWTCRRLWHGTLPPPVKHWLQHRIM